MLELVKGWLIKHVSFNTYLKIAKHLEPIERGTDLAKYVLFTRTREGNCLRGTVYPKIHRVISNSFFKSLPYLILLAVVIFAPKATPQCIADVLELNRDASVVSGFMTAILAIAGIFLTLFYTNATTVFSNKYPSSSGDLPRLFVSLVSTDKNLSYCTSFVITASFAFIACIVQWFNWLAFIYIFALAILLICKLPSILSLGTGKTDIAAITAIPANRFLTLAKASSFEKLLFNSDNLVLNFKKFANNDLSILDGLMDFSLMAGDYTPAYAKAVNDIVSQTLVKYSRYSVLIDAESHWHIKRNIHKAWFTSSTHELDLAISTGTIPQPKIETDHLGYRKELFRISNKYSKFLIDSNSIVDYSNFFAMATINLEYCFRNGDVEWAQEYAEGLLTQCLEFSLSVNVNNKEDLQAKCHLLEQYAVMLMTIPLELGKLCDRVAATAFHFNSFSSFSQSELQKQGFPLGDSSKMKALCKKLKYERDTFGIIETPAWWFNNNVDSFGLERIEHLCSSILLLHDRYCSNVKDLVESDSKSSYTLALKEAELYSKATHCIIKLMSVAKVTFGAEELSKNYLAELESIHDGLVRIYPNLAKAFMIDISDFEDFFPDLYGFALFNYCQLLLEDIVGNKLKSFCASIMPLYSLVIISSLDLQKVVSEGSYNDIYKAQILFEPTILFLELCGMAYAMAELHQDTDSQKTISDHVSSILETNQNVRIRWKACFTLCDDFSLNGKIYMDLFGWRRSFIDAVENSELYPDAPRCSFGFTSWKPPEEKKRLLEMLPPDIFELNDFSGCRIFKKYLLKMGDHDQQTNH